MSEKGGGPSAASRRMCMGNGCGCPARWHDHRIYRARPAPTQEIQLQTRGMTAAIRIFSRLAAIPACPTRASPCTFDRHPWPMAG